MIEYVEDLLTNWGEWLRYGKGVDLGLPAMDISQQQREGGTSGSGLMPPNRDPESESMDKIICKLPIKQKKSVIARYFYQWSDRKSGEKFGISYAAHGDRLNRAHINIDEMWTGNKKEI